MASRAAAVLLNIATLSLLLICLRFGIYLERRFLFVWTLKYGATTQGLSFANLENHVRRDVWNQSLAAGGVVVGGLTVVAFRLHEKYIRYCLNCRRSKKKGRSLLAGLPTRRGSGPEKQGGIWLDRSTLFGLAVASILASRAAVSALGMNLHPFTISSWIPQQRTQDLGPFYGHRDPNQPEEARPIRVPSTDMAAIVYRSAFRRTVDAAGDQSSLPTEVAAGGYLPADYVIDDKAPRIGQANYPDLRTRGVGVLPSRMTDNGTDWAVAAPGLTFHTVEGLTIGTNISAVCQDETMLWNWSHQEVAQLQLETAFIHRFDVTELRRGWHRHMITIQSDPAEIGVKTWLEQEEVAEDGSVLRSLRQKFIISRIHHGKGEDSFDAEDVFMMPSVRVVSCRYTGRDVRHRVSVSGDGTPIRFLEEDVESLEELSWSDMHPAASAINRVIGGHDPRGGGNGGALMAGMTHGGLQNALWFDSVEVDVERLLGDILTDAAQAYFSVWRQSAEYWSSRSFNQKPGGRMTGVALRIGGGGWFGVGVIASLAVLPLVALFRLTRIRFWDPSEELLDRDVSSDDGLSEDENQAMFIMKGAPKYEDLSSCSDESSND